jgi:uncharacterized protein
VIETPSGPVSARYDGPRDAPCLVILAHGAGAGMDHPFMSRVAAGIAAKGIRVVRFNFPYREAGRKAPDRAAVLESTFRAVVDEELPGHETVILGGKSMGGRIASHLVAQGTPAAGLLFLGYPLHPPGRPDRLRAAHLLEITTPMLFVEGTRDPFCPLETLEDVRASIAAETAVAVIEDGDHSFKVRKSSGRDTAAAWDEVVEVCSGWLDTVVPKELAR